MDKPVITGKTIKVPSSAEFLPDVIEFVEEMLRGYQVADDAIPDIAISVSELVNNAITHGNRAQPGVPVEVTVGKKNGTVEISISDQGNGFDPDSVPSPIADDNLLKEVGRGLFIVRSLMDTVAVRRTAQGTTVVISKSID